MAATRHLSARSCACRGSPSDGLEVDFVVIEGRRPVLMVETKLGDDDVARGLHALHRRFPDCAAWQVHATGKKDYRTPDGIRVAPAIELLMTLV